jgi:flagellar biosynthetic protein FliR
MSHVLNIALPQFQTLLVIIVRVSGILAAWPVLGSRNIPLQIKTGLVLMLGLVLLPVLQLPPIPADPLRAGAGMASEFMVGLVIGLSVRCLYAGVELAGELIGSQMGLSVAQILDPSFGQQVPLVSQFQTTLASLVFLALNAHTAVVEAIAHSFDVVPPFGGRVSSALLDDVLQLGKGLFVVAIKLSAPILAVVLMVNLGMAIMGRSVPQLNIFVLNFPLTIAAGFLILGVSMPYAVGLYESEYGRLLELIWDLLKVMGYG